MSDGASRPESSSASLPAQVLPWHRPLAETLEACLTTGALPHALLLTGPPGWGERPLAGWLAGTLLGIDSDGRDLAAVAHPDLRWIAPEGAVIRVDTVRELAEFAYGTPQAGPRKVAVVAEAHCLNHNAANALLKTLEEPPPGTHLILYSCHPGRLLPTIRSRCQMQKIKPDPALARAWLARCAPGVDLDLHMFEHGGAPVAVLSAIARDERPLEGLLNEVLGGAPTHQAARSLLDAGLAEALGRWYRYALALAGGDWSTPRLSEVPGRAVAEFAEELSWARRLLVTSNSANERLLAERLVSQWRQLARAAR